jgi:hypothetical protein
MPARYRGPDRLPTHGSGAASWRSEGAVSDSLGAADDTGIDEEI